jgi:signal transduction histidine kinase
MERVAEMARTLDPGSITKRIRLESSDTEVVRMRDELNGALERIEAGYRAQEGFISNVSHELKTPIAVLLAEAYSLRARGYDGGEVGRYLSSSEEELGRLGRLVESFLTLTRTELHFDPQEFGLADVNDFVLDAVDMAGPLAEVHDVAIDVRLHEADDDESPLSIHGDPQLLATMVVNLVRNAVRFTPKGGSLSIEVLCDAEHTRVRVQDDGPGIPVEFLPRMFERFAQAPEESRRRRGMGLGLSIAQRIATLHGGSISATNREEGGSLFEIRLPRQAGDAPEGSGPRDGDAGAPTSRPSPTLTVERNGAQPSLSTAPSTTARAQ